jgi:hypothetical protein
MIRDRDGIYGDYFCRRVDGMGVEQVLTAPRSPWQNPPSDLQSHQRGGRAQSCVSPDASKPHAYSHC